MNNLIVTNINTNEIIFIGAPDEFLEINNYDEELEDILNMVMNSHKILLKVSYDNEHYQIEKVLEEIY